MKMDKIRMIFEYGKNIASIQKDSAILKRELNKTDIEFRSVGYEGASMAIALEDLSKGDTLNNWNLFLQNNSEHSTQLYIGLGWALAQQRKYSLAELKSFSPLMLVKVMDGSGYYDAVFRQRQTNKNQIVPDDIIQNGLFGYYQGIGRSLWYGSKGEVARIPEMISVFPAEYHSDLWRGVGIACSYVGGCDEIDLKTLFSLSLNNYKQLAIGAALVARSRIQAKTITIDIELNCRIWCNFSPEEAMQLTISTEPVSVLKTEDSFILWIKNMEKEFILSSINN